MLSGAGGVGVTSCSRARELGCRESSLVAVHCTLHCTALRVLNPPLTSPLPPDPTPSPEATFITSSMQAVALVPPPLDLPHPHWQLERLRRGVTVSNPYHDHEPVTFLKRTAVVSVLLVVLPLLSCQLPLLRHIPTKPLSLLSSPCTFNILLLLLFLEPRVASESAVGP